MHESKQERGGKYFNMIKTFELLIQIEIMSWSVVTPNDNGYVLQYIFNMKF